VLGFLKILLSLLSTDDIATNNPKPGMDIVMYIAAMCMLNEENNINNNKNDFDRPAKHLCYNYNCSHVKAAVWRDYLCLYPLFDDKQFQHIFRVSKAIYETIRSAVQSHSPFSTNEFDCCGKESIGLDVKVLMALNINAYSVTANAFHNYFQTGKSPCASALSASMKQLHSARS